MNSEESAWVAGILEGEGYFGLQWRNGATAILPHASIRLNMTDGDVVAKVHRLTGVGHMSGPHPQQSARHKPFYKWEVHRADDIVRLLLGIRRHMGERRSERIDEIVRALVDRMSASARAEHGTRKKYERQGCRCDECRAGNTARHRAWLDRAHAH